MCPEAKALIEQFEHLNWFCNVGKAVRAKSICQVKSWDEATRMVMLGDSENARLESKNLLTERLAYEFKDRYSGKWNPLVTAIKKKTRPLVDSRAAAEGKPLRLPKGVTDAIHWDMMMACMELEYADIIPPRFFAERTKWYLAGHLPVGWEGDFPEGRLIIF